MKSYFIHGIPVRVGFDCARLMFRLCSTYVSTFWAKVGYVLTVLGIKLFLEREILVAKLLHMLDFQFRNISRAYRPGPSSSEQKEILNVVSDPPISDHITYVTDNCCQPCERAFSTNILSM